MNIEPYTTDNPLVAKQARKRKIPLPDSYKHCATCRDFENPTTCHRPIRKMESTTSEASCKHWRFGGE